jgi:hypothetical protein
MNRIAPPHTTKTRARNKASDLGATTEIGRELAAGLKSRRGKVKSDSVSLWLMVVGSLATTYYLGEGLGATLARAADVKQRKNEIEKTLAAGEVFGSRDSDQNWALSQQLDESLEE